MFSYVNAVFQRRFCSESIEKHYVDRRIAIEMIGIRRKMHFCPQVDLLGFDPKFLKWRIIFLTLKLTDYFNIQTVEPQGRI